MSDKDSVLGFIGEVVYSVSPVWSCCQGVSGCSMTGTLILKSNMTDLMPGQFLIALSYAVDYSQTRLCSCLFILHTMNCSRNWTAGK